MGHDTNIIVVGLGREKRLPLDKTKGRYWPDAEIVVGPEMATLTVSLQANPQGFGTLIKHANYVLGMVANEAFHAGVELHGLTLSAHQYDEDGELKALSGNS